MRVRPAAVVVALAGVIAVWILCLIPLQTGGGGTDKLEHMTAYFLQTSALLILFPRHRWKVVGWFLIQGATIEGLQALTGYRSAEWADMGANTLGIALGLALSFTPPAVWLSRTLDDAFRR